MECKRKAHIMHRLQIRRHDRGALQVEFLFTIMTLLLVVFVLFELCSAVYAYTVLSDAANEGVRSTRINRVCSGNRRMITPSAADLWVACRDHEVRAVDWCHRRARPR